MCRSRKFASIKKLIGSDEVKFVALIPQSNRNPNRMRVVLPYDSGLEHLGEKLRK